MGESFELGTPDVVTAGTVGRPGQRIFYLQFRTGPEVVSLRLEKQQVAAIGEYVAGLLADLPQPDSLPHPESLSLVEPVEPAWTVGTLGLAFDGDEDRIVLLAEEILPADTPVDEEGDPVPDAAALADQGRLTARMTRGQATALVARAEVLVASGRPACPLCGRPMDPDGHVCPRTNGHAVH